MMKKYRRRPIEIEAVQWVITHTPSDDAKPIVDFINANGGRATFVYDHDAETRYHPFIVIETLEGKMKVSPNDYVCRDVAGEFWGVKPHLFEVTNEEAPQQTMIEYQQELEDRS